MAMKPVHIAPWIQSFIVPADISCQSATLRIVAMTVELNAALPSGLATASGAASTEPSLPASAEAPPLPASAGGNVPPLPMSPPVPLVSPPEPPPLPVLPPLPGMLPPLPDDIGLEEPPHAGSVKA